MYRKKRLNYLQLRGMLPQFTIYENHGKHGQEMKRVQSREAANDEPRIRTPTKVIRVTKYKA